MSVKGKGSDRGRLWQIGCIFVSQGKRVRLHVCETAKIHEAEDSSVHTRYD